MELSLILALGGAAFCVAAASVLLLSRRKTKSGNPRALVGESKADRASEVDQAQAWIAERRTKLEGKLVELKALVVQLEKAGLWTEQDKQRLGKVEAEVADYLKSANERPEENLYGYRQLFHSGPYTTVPFTIGGWSISWGVWMTDAHLELLIRHGTSRLKLNALDGDKLEDERRFVAEVESKIDAAGFNGSDYFPRFRMENIARDVCCSRLVRFERSPFGLTVAEAVEHLRVADSLPDIGAMTDSMPSRGKADFMRLFQDYRTALDRSWRELTAEEKSTVLAALAKVD